MKKKVMILAAFLSLNIGVVLTSYADVDGDCIYAGQLLQDATDCSTFYVCSTALIPTACQCVQGGNEGIWYKGNFYPYAMHFDLKTCECVPITRCPRCC